jgi:hypothetical protein
MRRVIYLLILVAFIGTSASCVNASTDCERWFIAYRRELAHSRNLQRIAAAKRRAKLYAQHKIALVKPKPKPKVILARGPRMTRKETLHHFNLACGVLPDGDVDEPLIAEETPGPYIPEGRLDDRLDFLPSGLDEQIAQNDVPPPPITDGGSPGNPGGPPVFYPPYTGWSTPPGGGGPVVGTTAPPNNPPGTPGTPVPPPPDSPPDTPDVPEPASFVLLLTGIAGAAGALRSRFKA